MNTVELHKLLGDPNCDCVVCRNCRHREAVWARHNAGRDYIGIHRSFAEQMKGPRDPDWTRIFTIPSESPHD